MNRFSLNFLRPESRRKHRAIGGFGLSREHGISTRWRPPTRLCSAGGRNQQALIDSVNEPVAEPTKNVEQGKNEGPVWVVEESRVSPSQGPVWVVMKPKGIKTVS